MDNKKLEETLAGIALLKELGLPVSIEQLENLRKMEKEYLNENLVPEVQSFVQSLVEKMHQSFCLVVEFQYGSPVQVRVVEQTKVKNKATKSIENRTASQSSRRLNMYSSTHIEEAWKKFLKSLPKDDAFLKFKITQPYQSISKLLRVMRSEEMLKYTSPLFEALHLPANGEIKPSELKNILAPEQFVDEETDDGMYSRIVLWSLSHEIEILGDGTRVKKFETDGITPVVVKKVKKIQDGQWSIKVLCDLMAQKEYFENEHSLKP